jgi:hypothetical protein
MAVGPRTARPRSRPCEAADGLESLLGAGPVTGDRVRSGPADHRSQDERDEDRVVGVAEDRDEVGDQVDRHRQVGEQAPQPEAYAAGQRGVAREPGDEPEQVGQQPDRVTEGTALRPGQRQEGDEGRPEQEQAGPRREETGLDLPQELWGGLGASSTMSSNSPSLTPRTNASHSAGV